MFKHVAQKLRSYEATVWPIIHAGFIAQKLRSYEATVWPVIHAGFIAQKLHSYKATCGRLPLLNQWRIGYIKFKPCNIRIGNQ